MSSFAAGDPLRDEIALRFLATRDRARQLAEQAQEMKRVTIQLQLESMQMRQRAGILRGLTLDAFVRAHHERTVRFAGRCGYCGEEDCIEHDDLEREVNL